jgi:hypothetical protein
MLGLKQNCPVVRPIAVITSTALPQSLDETKYFAQWLLLMHIYDGTLRKNITFKQNI